MNQNKRQAKGNPPFESGEESGVLVSFKDLESAVANILQRLDLFRELVCDDLTYNATRIRREVSTNTWIVDYNDNSLDVVAFFGPNQILEQKIHYYSKEGVQRVLLLILVKVSFTGKEFKNYQFDAPADQVYLN